MRNENDRRDKARFPLRRELRYKLLKDMKVVEAGTGYTVNLSSEGVAFAIEHDLKPGCYIELSISWPVMLGDSCPVRFVSYGRLLRSEGGRCACTIDKYEFRTQARSLHAVATAASPTDSFFERWADGARKETMRMGLARVTALDSNEAGQRRGWQ